MRKRPTAATLWRESGLRGQAMREAYLVVHRMKDLQVSCPEPPGSVVHRENKKPRGRSARRAMTDAQVTEYAARVAAGEMTTGDVARAVGCAPSRASKWICNEIRRMGFEVKVGSRNQWTSRARGKESD